MTLASSLRILEILFCFSTFQISPPLRNLITVIDNIFPPLSIPYFLALCTINNSITQHDSIIMRRYNSLFASPLRGN